jgi:hypothetical protein
VVRKNASDRCPKCGGALVPRGCVPAVSYAAMRRRLVRLLPTASLLMCVAATVLWARANWSTDCLTRASHNLFQTASGDGGLCVQELSLFRREDDWTSSTGRTGPPPRLVRYTESSADYSEWASRTGRPAGRWAWDPQPAGDWQKLVGGPFVPGRSWTLPALAPLSLLQFTRESVHETPADGGFRIERKVSEELLVGRRLWLPYWLVIGVTGLWPALRLVGWLRRSRRTRDKLCRACGYDLRATPARCAECGAVPANAPT